MFACAVDCELTHALQSGSRPHYHGQEATTPRVCRFTKAAIAMTSSFRFPLILAFPSIAIACLRRNPASKGPPARRLRMAAHCTGRWLWFALAAAAFLSCTRDLTEPVVAPSPGGVRAVVLEPGQTLTAPELLQDPALDAFLGALTISLDAERIREAMDAVVADLERRDTASAYDDLEKARKAVADYGKGQQLDDDDDVHLDVIDLFLDGAEEKLPEMDGPPTTRGNRGR